MYEILAEYYDEMMSADYDAWYSYIKSLGIKGKVVELGCGTGNFTSRLCADGFSVTAVDISEEMLNCASRKCLGRRPVLIREDMVKFRPVGGADTVLIMCDGVNYVRDVQRLFEGIYSYLADDGALIFDVSSEHKLNNVLGGNTFFYESERADLVWQNFRQRDKLEMRLVFFEKEGHNYNKREENQRMFVYSADFLLESLKKAGFKKISVFGEFTRRTPRAECERIHFVCKKG